MTETLAAIRTKHYNMLNPSGKPCSADDVAAICNLQFARVVGVAQGAMYACMHIYLNILEVLGRKRTLVKEYLLPHFKDWLSENI